MESMTQCFSESGDSLIKLLPCARMRNKVKCLVMSVCMYICIYMYVIKSNGCLAS